jgi:hypothetical protein
VSEVPDEAGLTPADDPDGMGPSSAARLAIAQRAGGIIVPIFTVAIAFFMGGLVVLATATTRSRRTRRSGTARA